MVCWCTHQHIIALLYNCVLAGSTLPAHICGSVMHFAGKASRAICAKMSLWDICAAFCASRACINVLFPPIGDSLKFSVTSQGRDLGTEKPVKCFLRLAKMNDYYLAHEKSFTEGVSKGVGVRKSLLPITVNGKNLCFFQRVWSKHSTLCYNCLGELVLPSKWLL